MADEGGNYLNLATTSPRDKHAAATNAMQGGGERKGTAASARWRMQAGVVGWRFGA